MEVGVTVCLGNVLGREVECREVVAEVIHFSTKTRKTCLLQLVEVVVGEGVKVELDWSMYGNVAVVVGLYWSFHKQV